MGSGARVGRDDHQAGTGSFDRGQEVVCLWAADGQGGDRGHAAIFTKEIFFPNLGGDSGSKENSGTAIAGNTATVPEIPLGVSSRCVLNARGLATSRAFEDIRIFSYAGGMPTTDQHHVMDSLIADHAAAAGQFVVAVARSAAPTTLAIHKAMPICPTFLAPTAVPVMRFVSRLATSAALTASPVMGFVSLLATLVALAPLPRVFLFSRLATSFASASVPCMLNNPAFPANTGSTEVMKQMPHCILSRPDRPTRACGIWQHLKQLQKRLDVNIPVLSYSSARGTLAAVPFVNLLVAPSAFAVDYPMS